LEGAGTFWGRQKHGDLTFRATVDIRLNGSKFRYANKADICIPKWNSLTVTSTFRTVADINLSILKVPKGENVMYLVFLIQFNNILPKAEMTS